MTHDDAALERTVIGPSGLRAVVAGLVLMVAAGGCDVFTEPEAPEPSFDGRDVFRHATFGNEVYWTDTLRMDEVIESSVDPRTALSVGLKVDAAALPEGLLSSADLDDPATTVEMIRRDAVVGIPGTVDSAGRLTEVGITCALCHSTVDNSVMEGVGDRLDGRPNRDLDVGAIIALSPALSRPQKETLRSWGPGRYDAYWNQDGISDPVLIPPAYGLQGVELETYTGEGPISYWNEYVAVTQMHGQGSFEEPALGIDIDADEEKVKPRLPALRRYQLSLTAPAPPDSVIDPAAADRGEALFNGKAKCATCHVPPTYTDAGQGLHDPEETGMDPTLAERSITGKYRTTPLRGLVHHPPYFHDGSAETLMDVVEHYDRELDLGLTQTEKKDLVAFLETL